MVESSFSHQLCPLFRDFALCLSIIWDSMHPHCPHVGILHPLICPFSWVHFTFYFARFAPSQTKNAPNFRVPFDLALCIKISAGSQLHTDRLLLLRSGRSSYTNSQLKCLTERIRFFALTKPSAVRRYSRYVERNEAKPGRKRWCADWAILTRISIIQNTTEGSQIGLPSVFMFRSDMRCSARRACPACRFPAMRGRSRQSPCARTAR